MEVRKSHMTRPQKPIRALFLLGVAFLYACSSYQHERPKSVPSAAQWLGGADGGVWIKCLQQNASLLKCEIFDGDTGRILQSGTYLSHGSITQADLTAFDGRTLITNSEALTYRRGEGNGSR
jgi:hypothetical protein